VIVPMPAAHHATSVPTDAACSITCAYMAGTLLVGLVVTTAFGWWWADSVTALAVPWWLGHEAREALEGARVGRGGCSRGDESRTP
ncbi:MAG TPA: hypothetical protein VNL71_19885, partial [Chloroflexota bacterium]|nr:hypothetical protein [Chloroflexota bacterium]